MSFFINNPKAKILVIVEAPSTEEIRAGRLFIGKTEEEFHTILADAGLWRKDISLATFFTEAPPGNDFNAWAVPIKDEKHLVDPALPYSRIPCKKGCVEPKRVQAALKSIHSFIALNAPNVVVGLGNAVVAGLCGVTGLTKLRGALHFTKTEPARKFIPTFGPRAVFANYEWRPLVVADFMKAKLEAASPEANLLNRVVNYRPTINEVEDWADYLCAQPRLAFDIETKAKQITCIGFAPNKLESFVIPFWTRSGDYWPDPADEVRAYKAVRRICKSESIKIAQNGLYDISYLAAYGIAVNNFLHDTMIAHHALYPALPKGLDFLGSLYANEVAWKRWRVRGGDTNEYKREE